MSLIQAWIYIYFIIIGDTPAYLPLPFDLNDW